MLVFVIIIKEVYFYGLPVLSVPFEVDRNDIVFIVKSALLFSGLMVTFPVLFLQHKQQPQYFLQDLDIFWPILKFFILHLNTTFLK